MLLRAAQCNIVAKYFPWNSQAVLNLSSLCPWVSHEFAASVKHYGSYSCLILVPHVNQFIFSAINRGICPWQLTAPRALFTLIPWEKKAI